MNKNKHSFALLPRVRFNRTQLDLDHVHKTTMNVGDLCPVLVQEVLAGDTFKMTAKFLSRLTSSFIKVPLDNLYMDLNFFFVPNRLIWSKWVNLMGENTEGYWANQTSVQVPQIGKNSQISAYAGTLADYLGLPTITGLASAGQTFSQLPFRAFAKIWNDWYRNENTQAPVLFDGAGLETLQYMNSAPFQPSNIFGKPPKVSKFHDYFTSALPQAQKGSPVELTFGESQAPVLTLGQHPVSSGSNVLNFVGSNGAMITQGGAVGVVAGGDVARIDDTAIPQQGLQPSNLWAQLTGVESGITVNDIRYAFAIQNILERDARYGTRYTEYLQGQFGVTNPDLRLTRSEYLGGYRTPIQFQEVAQTSQGTEDSPQANLSAYSASAGAGGFVKSFGEDGFVIGVACIRQRHTYSQGVDKFWLRKNRFDFYNPALAHIGEQPIYLNQLYAAGGNPATIFGFQEAWAEYRYQPDRVSGYMRPNIENSLAVWNFADNYSDPPVLNQSFLDETSEYVDRTLSVPSSLTPNFIVDFAFINKATRLLPLYGEPELVDHVTTR